MLAIEGVHFLHRAEVWAEALGAGLKEDAAGVSYDEYLERGASQCQYASVRDLIHQDVLHVFPSHPRFVRSAAWDLGRSSGMSMSGLSDGGSLGCGADGGLSETSERSTVDYCLLDALERVLVATAARSPQGYCPAMCTVAGVLLMVADDEENAFWMLICFVEDLVPWLFTQSATALNAEATMVDFAVEIEFPELHAKLRAASVRPALLVAGWLTLLGIAVLPGEGALRLWDAVVLEGAEVLTQAVLAFLRLHREALLAIPTGGDSTTSDGAALLDAADELAAGQFRMDEIVAAAVESARRVRERELDDDDEWLRLRSAARAGVATRASQLGSLRELVNAFEERGKTTAREDDGESRRVSRVEFDKMVAATYPPVTFMGGGATTGIAAVTCAFEDARRHSGAQAGAAMEGRLDDGVTHDEFVRACREHPLLSAQLRLIELDCATVEGRVRQLLRGKDAGSARDDGHRHTGSAPSPANLAAAVRTAHEVIGVGATVATTDFVAARPAGLALDRRPRVEVSVSAASALESAMLFGPSDQHWLESVRLSPRGSLVLAAITSAVYAARPPAGAFEVSIVHTNDVVPSMGSLLVWPPRIPHTQYALLVQRAGAAPSVLVKRYNDFRLLHMRAEADALCLTVGPSLMLPKTGTGGFARTAFSSDPGVVALRSVGLQRYVDLMACSGCPRAAATLRGFLNVEDADDATENATESGERKKKHARGGCGGCGLTAAAKLDCSEFLGGALSRFGQA